MLGIFRAPALWDSLTIGIFPYCAPLLIALSSQADLLSASISWHMHTQTLQVG